MTHRILAMLAVGAMGLMAAGAGPAAAAPLPQTVNVLIVDSYVSGPLVWNHLNANWPDYGTTPIQITRSGAGHLTLAYLESTGADVVVLSDTAGAQIQLTSDDIAALQGYALEGHELFATFATFQAGGFANNDLMPTFGLVDQACKAGGRFGTGPTYQPRHHQADKPLFRNIAGNYASQSQYTGKQKPEAGRWSTSALNGATFAATARHGASAITLYQQGSYNAIYIASMPEYGGGAVDEQFLYNALTYSAA